MKVIYFSDTFLPKIDGIAVSIKNFSDLLSMKGHEFLICAPGYGVDDFTRLNENTRIERFISAPLPSYPDVKMVLPNPNRISQIIKEFQPELAHVHTPGLLGQYAIRVTERLGIPTIGTYHTLISEQDAYASVYRLMKLDKLFNKISRFDKLNIKDLLKLIKTDKFNINKKILLKLCNYFYDKCEIIISPSHLLKAQLLEFGIKKPIRVISNGLDLSRFKGEPKKLSENPRLLHVGRISYEKNCDVVINAFNLILKKIPSASLTIIGDGPALSSLKILAEKLKLQDKITFTGFVDHSTLHEHYPKYDLFMTASTMETQGLVVLEAISCGLPAIGVNAYAIPELVQEGKNGYNATPFKPEEMAEKTLSILENPSLYEEFSKNSLQIASGHELNRCADLMEDTYREVASLHKKKRTSLFNIIF
ncbi:MAG: glycosyltransferase [Leptospiraceae bacterium]|nr:glycosyltransferase [Leptospiraceae bacterium]MCP5501560.1 glycosyltransferase [Leptospiraceae bacterium]